MQREGALVDCSRRLSPPAPAYGIDEGARPPGRAPEALNIPDRLERLFPAALVLVVAVAAGLRLDALDFGLPHLMTRPDEEVILANTRGPASGDFDLGYGDYPTAYITLVWLWGAAGHALAQAVDAHPPGDYLHALDWSPWRLLYLDRLLSVLAGVATAVVVGWGGRRSLGAGGALAAAAIVATNYLHVRDSHNIKPDVMMGFLAIVALWAMAPLHEKADRRRAIVVGVAIGLAMAMKYPAVLLLVPGYLATVVGTAPGWARLVNGAAIRMGLAAAVAFLATSPDLFLNPETRDHVIKIVALVYPDLFPDAELPMKSVPPELGIDMWHPSTPLEGYAWYYGFGMRYGAGPVFALVLPIALGWAFLARSWFAFAAAGFGVVGFLVFGASPVALTRYLTPLMPAFGVVVGGALGALARRAPEGARAALLLVGITALVGEPTWRLMQHNRLLHEEDTRNLATAFLSEQLPAGAVVGVAGTKLWGWGEPSIPLSMRMERVELGSVEQLSDLDFLVVHDHVLFASRVDPGQLDTLRGRLHLVAEFDPFTERRDEAVFDLQDAYYVPIAGFDGVERPGPHVRVFAVEDSPGDMRSEGRSDAVGAGLG